MNSSNQIKVMVDLETLSTKPDAAIIAIGAVVFTGDPSFFKEGFYRVVRPQVGSIDYKTVAWWAQQTKKARDIFSDSLAVDTRTALEEFTRFMDVWKPVELWGNGATFDNVILRSSYEACGMSAPWSFGQDRCFRTLKNLVKVHHQHAGIAHNALDDAMSQVYHFEKICLQIKN